MRTHNLWIKVGVAAIAIFGASATAIACSGDDNNGNPTPAGEDAAADQTSSSGSSSGSSNSGSSSGSSNSGSSSGSGDSGCVPDATPNCSSCATDPYNACSAFTVNCVPFNNSVLPSPYPHF